VHLAGQSRLAVDEGGTVERGEEPLVRVHHEGVGPLDSGEEGAGTGGQESRSPVGGVDVEPQAPVSGHLGDPGQVVDDAGVGGPGRGHHGHHIGGVAVSG